jgi:hypothetical protein
MAQETTVLKQDSGKNFTEMNLTIYSAIEDFGLDGLRIGEAVKFTSPNPGWNLKAVQVLGWSGYNETLESYPLNDNFLIEVRDANLNLLYKFADAQNAYFASSEGPLISSIEIPALPLTGDFYVVFYDRGAMAIGQEMTDGTGNSYFFANGQMAPAEFHSTTGNETLVVNWIIRAVGE